MTDEEFMRLALKEARKGLGKTSPNPAVGAIIVQGGRVVAKGFHRRAGLPHAEIEALRRLPDNVSARGGTLYVTLEPCSTMVEPRLARKRSLRQPSPGSLSEPSIRIRVIRAAVFAISAGPVFQSAQGYWPRSAQT